MVGTPSAAVLSAFQSLPGYKNFNFEVKKEGVLKRVFCSQTDACVDLLQQLLAFDPASRISARDALAHPYFSEAPAPSCVRLLSAAAEPVQPKAKRLCRDQEHPAAAAAAAAAAAVSASDAAGEADDEASWVEALSKRQQAAAPSQLPL
ncbi:I WGS project CAKM00000000 data, strain SE8, contig 12, related [Eimeria acervulina]|uniref:I WGS project CAKM00000000 data, strain SE8, contig 12, related n=1 Tax=Eimeria acervulina TaxID=5801 RepID=U6GET5_EIMAC|nr:I WGS project CAKM00000000 data, strain SE8, contig 12, related [Eimeria acervulina]CDI78776.1 I WGS project CAKM00000000 data, strain SE8, contig 12, related [Eimeria acervulina]